MARHTVSQCPYSTLAIWISSLMGKGLDKCGSVCVCGLAFDSWMFWIQNGSPPRSVCRRWSQFQKSKLVQRTAGFLSYTMLCLFKSNILNKCVCMSPCVRVCVLRKKHQWPTQPHWVALHPNRLSPFFLRWKFIFTVEAASHVIRLSAQPWEYDWRKASQWRYSETEQRGTIQQQMQEIRLKLDLYMLTDKTQSWLGFPDDRTKLGGGREGTVDSTSSADRWAEERRSQIKETKGSWASEEKAMKHSIEAERKMKVQEERREIVGAECPPLVQCWAHVSCKNPILQTWQIVLPWEQQWGYCEERERRRKWKRERESKRDGERPDLLQQPSVTPAYAGTETNLPLERNVEVQPWERLEQQKKPSTMWEYSFMYELTKITFFFKFFLFFKHFHRTC